MHSFEEMALFGPVINGKLPISTATGRIGWFLQQWRLADNYKSRTSEAKVIVFGGASKTALLKS